jgi:hypothetical protein
MGEEPSGASLWWVGVQGSDKTSPTLLLIPVPDRRARRAAGSSEASCCDVAARFLAVTTSFACNCGHPLDHVSLFIVNDNLHPGPPGSLPSLFVGGSVKPIRPVPRLAVPLFPGWADGWADGWGVRV